MFERTFTKNQVDHVEFSASRDQLSMRPDVGVAELAALAQAIMVVLKNIPRILSPQLLSVLARMGHGDEIGQ